MKRRKFIKTGGVASTALFAPAMAGSYNGDDPDLIRDRQKVNFTRDGLDLTNKEYTFLLSELEKTIGIAPDTYSRGGVVEKLESSMAEWLGKESAIFMPTGTLANHLAVRKLAGNKRKVIVQADSHLNRDSGDCATTLSGLNLIPLAPGKTTFTVGDVNNRFLQNAANRVKTKVGVLSIESPVRRNNNRMFDFDTMKGVSELARENNIGLHLDGARLFNACVHLGKRPDEFASLFDTIYVSLYKNFNAASGAILAGSKEFTKDLYHTRRMFGGGMPSVWPFAAVALYYLDGFMDDYARSLKHADQIFALLEQNEHFKAESFPDGTNVIKLFVKNVNPDEFREKLKQQNIDIPSGNPETGEFLIKINPSILRREASDIASIFMNSMNQ